MATMRALVLMLFLTLTLPVQAGPIEPSPPADTTVLGTGVIIPGRSVGPLRLDMPLPQILEAAGAGYKREEFPSEKIILYEWRGQGIWVSLNLQDRTIRVISAFGTNSRYRTDKGLSLMETQAKMESLYGKAYRRWVFTKEKLILIRYQAIGLQVSVINDPGQPLVHGRIFQIGVFKPGELPPVREP